MNIKPINNLENKIKWSNSEIKYFDNFYVNNPKLGKLQVSIDKDMSDFDEIHITDKHGNNIGYETFIMDLRMQKMEGFFIRVTHDLCQSGARVGELIRLTSLMEFIKNNLNQIKLYSKDTAVLFHAKYGFEPQIRAFDERNMLLKKMIQLQQPEFQNIKEKAIILSEKIKADEIYPQKQREYCIETSWLGKDYINKLLKNGCEDKTPFLYGMNMILNQQKILQNKDFYNNLYKKQGIDFQI